MDLGWIHFGPPHSDGRLLSPTVGWGVRTSTTPVPRTCPAAAATYDEAAWRSPLSVPPSPSPTRSSLPPYSTFLDFVLAPLLIGQVTTASLGLPTASLTPQENERVGRRPASRSNARFSFRRATRRGAVHHGSSLSTGTIAQTFDLQKQDVANLSGVRPSTVCSTPTRSSSPSGTSGPGPGRGARRGLGPRTDPVGWILPTGYMMLIRMIVEAEGSPGARRQASEPGGRRRTRPSAPGPAASRPPGCGGLPTWRVVLHSRRRPGAPADPVRDGGSAAEVSQLLAWIREGATQRRLVSRVVALACVGGARGSRTLAGQPSRTSAPATLSAPLRFWRHGAQ